MPEKGRPSKYTEEVAGLICEKLAEGQSLVSICNDEDMPHTGTVYRWLDQKEDFRDRYARAREAQADTLFDECLSIADQYSTTSDTIDTDHIQRAKLRIDTRKWMAGKLRPKKYGDKIQNEHTGADGGPIQTQVITPEQARKEIESAFREPSPKDS